MGEGAAALVLERWDRAVARGARIYGEVVGYGRNADAYHITAPSPGGEGAAACMQLALDDAGLSPAAIGHVNAHGTSTPLNDAAEAEAIRKVFGDVAPPVTSTKGVTGHLIGAAGATEAIACLLDVRERRWSRRPRTSNGSATTSRSTSCAARPARSPPAPALSNSFGFGGHNATLVFAPRVVNRWAARRSTRGPTRPRRPRSETSTAAASCGSGSRAASTTARSGSAGSGDGRAGGRARGSAADPARRRARHVGRRAARRRRRAARVGAPGPGARRTSRASCPPSLAVTGACVSGPALALGLFDHVVMTERRVRVRHRARVGRRVHRRALCTRSELGRRGRARGPHGRRVARRARRGRGARRARRRCSRISPTTTSPIRRGFETDDRPIARATSRRRPFPTRPTASYDVRTVDRRRRSTPTRSSSCGAVRAEPRHRLRRARRPAGRRRRQPAARTAPARSTSKRRARRRASSRGATRSTCRSARSSTRPDSSPAATSNGAA